MGIKTGYKGYKAYDYLTPGEDYMEFALTSKDRLPEWLVPLSAEQEKRSLRLAEEKMIISMHEHPVYNPLDLNQYGMQRQRGRSFCAYEGLAESYLDVTFDNLMNGSCCITSHNGWKWTDIVHDLGMRLCDVAHQDFLVHVRTADEIEQVRAQGKIAWVACIEGAMPIEHELDLWPGCAPAGSDLLGVQRSGLRSEGGSGLGSDCLWQARGAAHEQGGHADRRLARQHPHSHRCG